ncbi:MAG: chorismate mutase [Spirochaetota bacterium]
MKIYALRGAIQLREDSKDAMELAVGRLLGELSAKNRILPHRIIQVVFSQTGDLRNANPATALRKGGFDKAPLFCTQEPVYPDSLPRTVRVLLLCRAPFWSRAYWSRPAHCYLEGAASLRPDLSVSLEEARR